MPKNVLATRDIAVNKTVIVRALLELNWLIGVNKSVKYIVSEDNKCHVKKMSRGASSGVGHFAVLEWPRKALVRSLHPSAGLKKIQV